MRRLILLAVVALGSMAARDTALGPRDATAERYVGTAHPL